jgi:hypothetical protein
MADMATIYMPLLNEGTDVWRPVAAAHLNHETLRVIGPMPDDEEWAFPPGSVVTVARQVFADGSSGTVAVALAKMNADRMRMVADDACELVMASFGERKYRADRDATV